MRRESAQSNFEVKIWPLTVHGLQWGQRNSWCHSTTSRPRCPPSQQTKVNRRWPRVWMQVLPIYASFLIRMKQGCCHWVAGAWSQSRRSGTGIQHPPRNMCPLLKKAGSSFSSERTDLYIGENALCGFCEQHCSPGRLPWGTSHRQCSGSIVNPRYTGSSKSIFREGQDSCSGVEDNILANPTRAKRGASRKRILASYFIFTRA